MDMFDMEENGGILILQGIIIVLALIIVYMLYSDKVAAKTIEQKIDSMECPECPSNPECPDCVCSEGGVCPDCICDTPNTELSCPKCPECPKHDIPSVDDIVNAIFPGRNQGITAHGNYFPLDGLSETDVEPAFSPVVNMMPNYMPSGVPSSISFQDQMLQNENSSIGIASEVPPPMDSGAGVFSQPSQVAGDGEEPRNPGSETVSTNEDTTE